MKEEDPGIRRNQTDRIDFHTYQVGNGYKIFVPSKRHVSQTRFIKRRNYAKDISSSTASRGLGEKQNPEM